MSGKASWNDPVQGHNVKNWKSSQELDSKLGGMVKLELSQSAKSRMWAQKGPVVEVSGLKGH